MDSSGIIFSDAKCSTGMRERLDEMIQLLRCPICKDVREIAGSGKERKDNLAFQ